MYPIEKYRYYEAKTKDGREKVIAISTYAGKTVRGVAICDTGDEFALEKGKELAAARCAAKIADKRVKRASAKVDEASRMIDEASAYYDRMINYCDDAWNEKFDAEARVQELLNDF